MTKLKTIKLNLLNQNLRYSRYYRNMVRRQLEAYNWPWLLGKGKHRIKISLKQFGLSEYFDVLETDSPDAPNKLNGIRSVLKRFQAEAEGCLYVGDAPSDIVYCKEIGIPIAAAACASTADITAFQALNPEWLFKSVKGFQSWVLD